MKREFVRLTRWGWTEPKSVTGCLLPGTQTLYHNSKEDANSPAGSRRQPSSRDFMEILRFLKFWRLVGWLLVLGVVYLSLTPSPPDLKLGIPAQDKFGHFTAYTLLAWWFSQAYPWRLRGFFGIFLISLGVSLEFVQYYLGHRHFEYPDMLANTLGVVGGCLLALTPAGAVLRRLERFWETYVAS